MLDGDARLVYTRCVQGSFTEGFGAAGLDEWRAKVDADLRGADLGRFRTSLSPGTTLEPLYVEASGVMPRDVPRRAGPWRVIQEYDDPRMEVCSSAIAEDLARGVEGVWLVAGLDHGTRVLTAGDLSVVLRSVDLARVPVYLEPEGDALGLGLALAAVADERGVPLDALHGGFGFDPLGTLARTGTLGSGWTATRRQLGELACFAAERTPGMRTALVSTRAYVDAGATEAQELAWALATALEYIRALLDAGIALEPAARQLVFALGVTDQPLQSIAKLRAMRWLWAKAMAASAAGAEARRAHIHARSVSARRNRRDPWVNLLRGTAEVFAGALGGADSVGCAPFDVAIGPSDAFARRVARNTQLVLREESHLDRVEDPAAGAYALESLTTAFAREAWGLFREVEAKGGMARAIRNGHVAAALDARRSERLRRLGTRREPVLGVSEFPLLDEAPVVRDAVRLEEVEAEIGNTFSESTAEKRHGALLTLVQALRDRNAEPGAIATRAYDAVRLGVDVFSLAMLLRAGQPSLFVEPLVPLRPAAPWEALRDQSDRFVRGRGHRPRALLATLGPLAEHHARLSWTQNLLAAAGVESVFAGSADVAGATAAMDASDADVAVIVCANERHETEAAELAPALKAKGARLVLLAGKPPAEVAATLKKRGVDDWLFAGDDVLATLTRVMRAVEGAS